MGNKKAGVQWGSRPDPRIKMAGEQADSSERRFRGRGLGEERSRELSNGLEQQEEVGAVPLINCVSALPCSACVVESRREKSVTYWGFSEFRRVQVGLNMRLSR